MILAIIFVGFLVYLGYYLFLSEGSAPLPAVVVPMDPLEAEDNPAKETATAKKESTGKDVIKCFDPANDQWLGDIKIWSKVIQMKQTNEQSNNKNNNKKEKEI